MEVVQENSLYQPILPVVENVAFTSWAEPSYFDFSPPTDETTSNWGITASINLTT